MPYVARKSGGSWLLTKPGSKRKAKRTAKHTSKKKAMAQAYAIMQSKKRRS